MKRVISLAMLIGFLFVAGVTAFAKSGLSLIPAKGTVNMKDIGGRGLYVFSMWDTAQNSFVKTDGSFTTVIASGRAQKLSVKDSKKATRALAIALPQNPDNIVFDAESTALAVLLSDASLFRNYEDMQRFFKKAAANVSFQSLAVFLRKNLPFKTLEELTDDEQYRDLVRSCNKDLFHEDSAAIKKSLYGAREEIEKILREK